MKKKLFAVIILMCLSMILAQTPSAYSSVIKVLHISVLAQNEVQRVVDNTGATPLFVITQVGIEEFNSGIPNDLRLYDVIVLGINDWGEQLGDMNRRYLRLDELEAFAREGGGIIWTHDTGVTMGLSYGPLVEEPAGIEIRNDLNIGFTFKKAQITNDHPVLHFPFEIGSIGDIVDIQSQAPWPHVAGGRITEATRIMCGYDITEVAPDSSPSTEDTDNFYVTAHEYFLGRVMDFELGHLTLREDRPATDFWMPPLAECQLFVNALAWTGFAPSPPTTPPVGGEWVPINRLQLLTPWISIASLMTVITVSFVYVRHKKKQQN